MFNLIINNTDVFNYFRIPRAVGVIRFPEHLNVTEFLKDPSLC